MSSAKFSWSRSSFQNAAARASRQVPSQAAGQWLGPDPEKEHVPEVQRRRIARLVVDSAHGAGIEVSFEPLKGFLLARISETPGQPELREGDLIVAAGGHCLKLAREEEADEVLATAISDGVELEVEGPDRPQHAGLVYAADHEAVDADLCGSRPSLEDVNPDVVGEIKSSPRDEDDSVIAPNPEMLPLVTSFGNGFYFGSSIDCTTSPEVVVESSDGDRFREAESGGSSDSEGVTFVTRGLPLKFDSRNSDSIEAGNVVNAQPQARTEVVEGETVAAEQEPETLPLPSTLLTEASSESPVTCRSPGVQVEDDVPKAQEAIIMDAVVEALLQSCSFQVSPTPVGALSSTLCAVGLPSDTADDEKDCEDRDGIFDAPLPEIPAKWATVSRQETPATNDGASVEEIEAPPQPHFAVSPDASEVVAAERQEKATPLIKLEKVSSAPLNLEICLQGQHAATKIPQSFSRTEFHIPDIGHCKVHELWDWLCELRLQEYYAAATKWCIEMGAANLEELAENIDDLIEALALKPIERQRVQKWATQALASGSCSYGWGIEAPMESHANSYHTPAVIVDTRSLASERDSSTSVSAPIYTSRSVRLAMDSRGSTGLSLHWCDEWGILVEGVDPLPGQPGLRQGDFIVAIDGCSLRHRTHEECDAIFIERLHDGAVLSIVTPTFQDVRKAENEISNEWPESISKVSQLASLGKVGPHRFPRAPSQATGQLGWKLGKGGPRRGRTGGYDANSMWRRFRGPVW